MTDTRTTRNFPVTAESLVAFAPLAGLALTVRQQIAARAEGRRLGPGQVIISGDETARDVYLIVSGRVRVTYHAAAGTEVTFRDQVAGEMFGEIAAIDGGPRSARVEAVEETFLIALSAADFNDLMSAHPSFMAAVLTHLAGIVRALTQRVVEFSARDVPYRVRAELLRLAETRRIAGGGARIEPARTHALIASSISTRREAVSREISALTKAGVVERRGRAIVIPDLERLRRLNEAAEADP